MKSEWISFWLFNLVGRYRIRLADSSSPAERTRSFWNSKNTSRLRQKNQDYADLEDEFRMALQIEAKRFHEVYNGTIYTV